jgi:hypothetical protein
MRRSPTTASARSGRRRSTGRSSTEEGRLGRDRREEGARLPSRTTSFSRNACGRSAGGDAFESRRCVPGATRVSRGESQATSTPASPAAGPMPPQDTDARSGDRGASRPPRMRADAEERTERLDPTRPTIRQNLQAWRERPSADRQACLPIFLSRAARRHDGGRSPPR